MADVTPDEVLAFWFTEAGPDKWYVKDEELDHQITERFESIVKKLAGTYERVSNSLWQGGPKDALATIIVLDQFPRNIYRGSAQSFQYDPLALHAAEAAIAAHQDTEVPEQFRSFFYLPFMHSEDLEDQEQCVRLFETRMNNEENLKFAVIHRDIIKKFGRFPHRNELLDRVSTPGETTFLSEGGFAG